LTSLAQASIASGRSARSGSVGLERVSNGVGLAVRPDFAKILEHEEDRVIRNWGMRVMSERMLGRHMMGEV
jgi:hypothetical protein